MSGVNASSHRRGPVLAVLLLAGVAPAQDKPAGEKRQFFETAQVNLINVEVVVTDRSGKPVTGLTQADFEVFEDGRPVAITNFYAAESPGEATGAAGPPAPPVPPVEQRLSVVVLVDNSGVTGAERNMALRHARDLLATCLRIPHTQAMVVTLDQRVHVRQEFTSDAGLLSAALDKVKGQPTDPTTGAIDNVMIERAMDRLSLTSQPTDLGMSERRSGIESADFNREEARALLSAIRSSAEASRERVRGLLASMVTFVESLAGFPGRKVVFYLGNGLLLHPGESLMLKWESRFGSANVEQGFSPLLEASRYSLTTDFRDLIAHANADRVTFYAIDAAGSARLTAPSAEQPVLDPSPGASITETMGKQQSLQDLTLATGGTTIASTPAASPGLALALGDLETYYSLAYAAPRIGDGKDHSITVKVHREGVVVRYRRHYLDKTADERVIERNLSALLHNSGSNSLDIDVSVGKPLRRDSGTFSVPLVVDVPLGKLVLLPEGQTHRASVSIFLAAKDLDDRITAPVKRQFPITVPDDKLATAMGQNVRFIFEMLMTRGPQTVAVSVRDDLGQVEATVSARFSVVEHANQVTIQSRGS